MATGGNTPLTEAEADALLAPLRAYDRLVLAVSGGADSTALLHLAHGWSGRLRRDPKRLVAVTIDHQLRPESAAEAAQVAQQARSLGISHRTLAWCGEKPATGLQAAARTARSRLLAGVAQELARDASGAVAIVTAHTADDQAETMLMRLARGSGVDGLAAIPSEGTAATPDGVEAAGSFPVLRPLLAVPHARLVITLETAGIAFVEDPSNRNARFERVRVREALRVLEGLGVTRDALARTAARMQAARRALERAADELEARAVTMVLGLVHEIDLDGFVGAPDETAVRVLRRVLTAAGGDAPAAELGAIEDAAARIVSGRRDRLGLTLGGCVVEALPASKTRPALIRVFREPDRDGGLPRLTLNPGESVLWDGRFWAEVGASHPQPAEVGSLGADWPQLALAHPVLGTLPVPAAAARGIPVFRREGRIISAPLLAAYALAAGDRAMAVELAGPSHPSGSDGNPNSHADLRTERRTG